MGHAFKPGDRVELIHELAKQSEGQPWVDAGYRYGVLDAPLGGRGAVGDQLESADPHANWRVRWDEYDYRLESNPANCHHVNEAVIVLDELDERDLAETLASIQQSVRNTTSTGGSHE